MIHIDPVEPDHQEWRDWRSEADEAAKTITSAADIDPKLYKRGRKLVLDLLLFGKCAYCEVKVTADQIFGDVDHFRPKTRVRDKDDNLVADHRGYFWLAYDWLNLFPSCIMCNRPHNDAEGKSTGKWDRFPLEDESKRARTRTDQLSAEKPLLLNPFEDDPAQHLAFDPDLGTVSGTTDRGRETIRVLDLNREGLIDLRRQLARAATDNYNEYLRAVQSNNEAEKKSRDVDVKGYKKGALPFSAIARTAMERVKKRMLEALQN